MAEIGIVTERLPFCFQKHPEPHRREYLHPSKRTLLIKKTLVHIYKNNFIECYYERVGDEEVISSPTSSSSDC